MTRNSKKVRVREPVQVYFTSSDRKPLREVALAADVSGAEILRRGLRRMAGDILSERNPAMQLLQEMNAAEWRANMRTDAGLHHDRYLADAVDSEPRPKRRRK